MCRRQRGYNNDSAKRDNGRIGFYCNNCICINKREYFDRSPFYNNVGAKRDNVRVDTYCNNCFFVNKTDDVDSEA